ncbi:protein rep [Agromyces sp. NPDC057865]|uniref:protein rep n=1 Tax=Agromyces sp. NPDC057865 TaxID=3346267 RepID=UPI003672FD7B
MPCRRRVCPWCSRRVAASTRDGIAPRLRQFSDVVQFTSSLESSHDLTQAWSDHQRAISRFSRNGWLTGRTAGWFRATETTHSADHGWHVHSHWLLFHENALELRRLVSELPQHWIQSAHAEALSASTRGQHAAMSADIAESVRYVTKGLMEPSRRTDRQTPGDILRSFQAGGAEAAELWAELEGFTTAKRRRWTASGGCLRGTTRIENR